MLLLLAQNLADVLRNGELAQGLALADAFAVRPDGVGFVLEIGPQHAARIVGHLHGLGLDARRSPEVVDLLGDGERVLELFAGMLLELLGDRHELGALQHL